MKKFDLNHLQVLEEEAIFIIREAAAEFEQPVMLYSAGKDSSVLMHLVKKAFHPAKIPFSIMHVDTGKKFPEMYSFRDKSIKEINAKLIVWKSSDNFSPFEMGIQKCCGHLKTKALLNAISHHKFDAAISGARREEERSRAKERICSFRDKYGQWDPKRQRPEVWNLYNTNLKPNESMRIFPLSNWTELDIWHYIASQQIPVVSLYFAKKRQVVIRNNQYLLIGSEVLPSADEKIENIICRFRTLGCYPCTSAILSKAETIDDIIHELKDCHLSERSTRAIDHDIDASMEYKKREGYF